jgi:hypothetical protein
MSGGKRGCGAVAARVGGSVDLEAHITYIVSIFHQPQLVTNSDIYLMYVVYAYLYARRAVVAVRYFQAI